MQIADGVEAADRADRADHADGAAAHRTRARLLASLNPLLFAAYPVLFLWSQNLGEVDAREVLLSVGLAVLVAAVATLVLGRLLGDLRRGALVVTPLIFGLLIYGQVAGAIRPIVRIPAFVQQAGWAALVVVAAIAAVRAGPRRIGAAAGVLTKIGAVLVAVTLALILPFEAGSLAGAANADAAPRPDTTTAQKRDVYWLIFDRYGSDRSEQLQYRIQNDLTPWLSDRGFAVLPDSHANYVRTALSLGATMSMSHLPDMAGLPKPTSSDLSFIDSKIRSSLVARQFKTLGYRFVNIGSWWEPTGTSPLADENLRLAGPSEFVSTLIDQSALPAIEKRLHLGQPADARVRHYANNEYGLDAVERMRDEPGPKFVFGHILLPHPPLVYDRDGSFMTTDQEHALSANERFRRQLDYTNGRIRDIVSGLLSLPKASQPIVILQADEGPWSAAYSATRSTTFDWANASDDALEVKYGILDAWYLPGGEQIGLYPTMTSINTFPTLFRGYFGLDVPNLPDRIYTSKRWTLPYDLTDVTDRLPSAG